MSCGWLLEEATMTMESEARENQRIACKAEEVSGRDPGDEMVEVGIAVNQKNCARERKNRGKSRENSRNC
jgi:hypothetical protein